MDEGEESLIFLLNLSLLFFLLFFGELIEYTYRLR